MIEISEIFGFLKEFVKIFNNPELKKINQLIRTISRLRIASNFAERDQMLFDDFFLYIYKSIKLTDEQKGKVRWYKKNHKVLKRKFNKYD